VVTYNKAIAGGGDGLKWASCARREVVCAPRAAVARVFYSSRKWPANLDFVCPAARDRASVGPRVLGLFSTREEKQNFQILECAALPA
jgi:hypothetical protein